MRKNRRIPGSLDEAIERCTEAAETRRRPAKVMADLMGIELKTYYRWLAESSIPLNRVRQFEEFCGAAYVSEYLCLASGNKVVIGIACGKKASVTDLAELQANAAEALALLARFYQSGESMDDTVASLTRTLSEFAYHRSNVLKTGEPELGLFEE